MTSEVRRLTSLLPLPTSPTLLNEFNWEHTEQARPRGRSVACIRSMPWRVFALPRRMACNRGTLPMVIPGEPEHTLLWLSGCGWDQGWVGGKLAWI